MFAYLLPAIALVLLIVAFFAPAYTHGLLLAPGDGWGYYFPIHAVIAQAWKAGELPFWNPYPFGGTPLLASLQGGVFYPGNWAFALLPPALAMNVTVVAAYVVAALAAFAFARAIGLGRLAACLGAAVFALSGYMVAHLEHLTMIQAASLLPAMLWAIERHRRTLDHRWAIAFGGILALQVLVGYPQSVVQTMLVVGPYALWRSRGLGGRLVGHLAALAAASALGLALTAVQLVPSADLLAESQRQVMPYAELVKQSLPPRQLLTLWFPFLFGGFPSGLYPTPYWGEGPWLDELVGYAGLGSLVLAVWGLLARFKDPQVKFWALVAVCGLVLALGGYTPLYHVWAQLPLIKLMRVPGRHWLEVDFALAMLAAHGLQALDRPGPRAARRAFAAWALVGLPLLVVTAGVGAVGGALAARLQPFMPTSIDMHAALRLTQPAFWVPALTWALVGAAFLAAARYPGGVWRGLLALVVVADLALVGQFQGWRLVAPSATPGLGHIPPRAEETRLLSISATGYPYYTPSDALALRYGMLEVLTGERAAHGYEPLLKSRYSRLVGGISHGGAIADPAVWQPRHHALDVLGVTTLKLDAESATAPAWRARLAAPRWVKVGPGEFRNPRALPRAWRVASARVVGEAEVDRRMTADPAFDPRREALLDDGAPPATTPGAASAHAPTPDTLRLTTDGPGPGLVVVSEGYDPGWKAFEGDRELPVRRVDGIVLGVEVGPGAHTITLRYRPARWGLAVAVSGGALALGLGWLVALGRRRRRRPS